MIFFDVRAVDDEHSPRRRCISSRSFVIVVIVVVVSIVVVVVVAIATGIEDDAIPPALVHSTLDDR
jgi:hypothetical protein